MRLGDAAPGDEVLVRARVVYHGPLFGPALEVLGTSQLRVVFVPPDTQVERAAWRPVKGSRVTLAGSPGCVRAVVAEKVWLALDDGTEAVVPASELSQERSTSVVPMVRRT